MNLYKFNHEVKVELIKDEALLRLLYYKPINYFDNPLDKNKLNVTKLDDASNIIDKLIKHTPNVDGLDENPICRICVYAGKRYGTRNKKTKMQELIFDIFAHRSFHEVDLRMYQIADRVDDIVRSKNLSSFGRVEEKDAYPLFEVAKNYFGYRIIYLFGELDVK